MVWNFLPHFRNKSQKPTLFSGFSEGKAEGLLCMLWHSGSLSWWSSSQGFEERVLPHFEASLCCLCRLSSSQHPPTSRINPRALLSASLTWSSSLWRVTWLCVSSFLRTAESDLHSCYHTQTTPLWSWENTIHVHIHGHSKKPSWCWTTASGLWTVPVWCKMC